MGQVASPLAFAVNSQKDIHQVDRRLDAEAAAFSELRSVLERHGLERKYGITLLHKHFDLAEDEMMVEHTDVASRTLISRPAKIDSVAPENMIEVTWSLDRAATAGVCVWRCYYDANSTPQHAGKHMAG